MTPEQFARIERLFEEACELPIDRRIAWLDEQCPNDSAVREKVAGMLARDGKHRSVFESPALGEGFHVGRADAAEKRLRSELEAGGRFRIHSELGRGGFGAVYLAEQLEPLRRQVAIKVIKSGMDTRLVIERFAAERQALAMMEHPNIARVFDAGETESGRPYFVMEFVAGVPVTRFCETAGLSLPERLELFVTICHAVQHAHMKGIIHRDVKPTNILITEDGVPKLIDFGIARAVGEGMEGQTLFTEQGQMIGTPEYMSPEQAGGNVADLDTRTDVYSLGVLIYELLTDTTPIQSGHLRGAGPADVQRAICDSEIESPSQRLRAQTASRTVFAEQAVTSQSSMSRNIRGDLDWIVMKALEKERSRRYQTVNDFLQDIRRYLGDEPVLARPPTASYRFRKFARRHRGALAAGVAMFLLLVAGVLGTSLALIRAVRARDSAQQSQRTAETERQRATAIGEFIENALQSANPFEGGKQDMRVSEAMQAAIAELNNGKFIDQPATEAGMCLTISKILSSNAHPTEALSLAERALKTLTQLHGDTHPYIARAHDLIAISLHELGRAREAEPHSRAALEMRRRLRAEDHPDTAKALSNLGVILQSLGRYDEADSSYAEALAMYERLVPGDHPDVARCLASIASVFQAQGRHDDAERSTRNALDIWRRLYPDGHPVTARTMCNLTSILLTLGRIEEADEVSREALEMYRRLFPSEHPDVAIGLTAHAYSQNALGYRIEAERLLREALELRVRLNPGDHQEVARSMIALAGVLLNLGRLADAEPYLRNALEMNMRVFPGDHPATVTFSANLAACLARLDRMTEAFDAATQASEMASRVLPANHPTRLQCDKILAQISERMSGLDSNNAATSKVAP